MLHADTSFTVHASSAGEQAARHLGGLLTQGTDAAAISIASDIYDTNPMPGDACIVTPADPSSRVLQLVDRLLTDAVPAVLVFEPSDARRSSIASSGLMTASLDDDPGTIRTVLATAYRCGVMLDGMRTELRSMRAWRAGLEREMGRIHDELQLAASVQREFIPTEIPTLNGWDVGVVFRPAGYVSGDIYDVSRISDRYSSVFLADAVGHGVPAALMTVAIARALVTTDNHGNPRDPGEVLSSINDDMVDRNGSGGRFATAVYALLDHDAGTVTIASAGHPPAMHLTNGDIDRIDDGGPLLGVFAGAEFPAITIDVAKGDAVVLFSDGMETAFQAKDTQAEALRSGNVEYVPQLEALARQTGRHTPLAIEAFERALDEQAGSLHQPDDITALVISRAAEHVAPAKAA